MKHLIRARSKHDDETKKAGGDGQEILVANKIYIKIFHLKLANLRTMSSITMYKSLSSERYRVGILKTISLINSYEGFGTTKIS